MWPLLVLHLIASPADDGWEESGRTDGVIVYVRSRAGSESLRETLAIGAIDAPPWVVKNAIDDWEAQDGAMPYMREMRVLSRSGRSGVVYHRTAPPLVTDRDYTIRMIDESYVRPDDSVVYVSRWVVANELGPPPRIGVVRVTVTEGYWKLEPIDDGKRTRASYFVFADPGGSVPKSVAQWGTNTMLGGIFNAIRARARNPKYRVDPPPVPSLRRDEDAR
jgi:hypothetical protein